jgi:hypothetical protein
MTKLITSVHIIDDNGIMWSWDGEHLWVTGDNIAAWQEENDGYFCDTLDEVFSILIQGDYLEGKQE